MEGLLLWSREEMSVDQTRVGGVEDSRFNLEVKLTAFANGMDVGTEWKTGVKDAGVGNCRAPSDVP